MKRTLSELKATAIAVALSVSLLALASCNSTSDTDSMQTTDMTNDQELDPQGLLSSLSFKSSADDAQFQCLLSAIDSTAAEQDLKSYAPTSATWLNKEYSKPGAIRTVQSSPTVE